MLIGKSVQRLAGKTNDNSDNFVRLVPHASLLSLHSSHTQAPLLFDGLQLICADGLCDKIQLLTHGLIPECHTDVRNVGPPDVITLLSLLDVARAEPGAFHLMQRRSHRTVKPPAEHKTEAGAVLSWTIKLHSVVI